MAHFLASTHSPAQVCTMYIIDIRYHESNFDKYEKYGSVVREEGLCNFPLYHLFDADDIDQIFKYKSDTPLRPYNEADVYYRKYRKDLYENIGMVNENGPKWLELRKNLSPPLTSRKTSQFYAEPMNEIADELVTVMMQNIDTSTNTLKGKHPTFLHSVECHDFLSLIFCEKSILGIQEVQNLPFWHV